MTIQYIIPVIIAVLVIYFYYVFFPSNKEHMVDLSTCKRKNMIKCCTNDNCYDDTYGDSKPDFLRANCDENKKEAKEILDKSYEQMFTPSEYNNLIKDLHIYNDYYTYKDFLCQKNKYNKIFDYENNNINRIIGEDSFNKIIKDDYGNLPGYFS